MSLTTIDFSRLSLTAGERVLDLGCGEGRHAITAYLEDDIQAVGLDLSFGDLETAATRFVDFARPEHRSTLLLTQASGLALPFADDTFDVVICSEVLEHIPDYESVLAEIDRVLTPTGRLAVSVPRFAPEWICWRLSRAYHQVEGGHIRIFRTGQLRRAIERLPFRLVGRHWAHALHSPYWWLKCLFWSVTPDPWPVRAYHRLLVWDLMTQPPLTRALDWVLNPIMGKSVVVYFNRPLASEERS